MHFPDRTPSKQVNEEMTFPGDHTGKPGLPVQKGTAAILGKSSIISVIDDDYFVRESIDNLVRSLGYEVAAFESAEQFLESGLLPETSCVITDLQMPGLSGLDLQHYLIAQGHRTPVIFVTADPEERFRRRALDAGALGFLGKPFDEEALINCLESIFRGRPSATAPVQRLYAIS
jgi:FixJ family two-component response regulator